MKKQKKIQLILLFVGVFLFASTYLFYPSINNKDKTLDYIANNETKKNIDTSSSSSFENLEYKGMYNFNQPFNIKSKEAYILNDQPNIVYMKKMHVKLFLIDGRVISITSDKGKYNKETFDCFFENNVKATDENTTILAENMDLLATKNYMEIYNNVNVDYVSGNLKGDKINYNFTTKKFKVSMFDDKTVKMRIFR
tara:strand:- start:1347 stop:1934 length:588 start_codon:yes stop_codon:yes gene_type:complete